jgi:hypothetical protein
MAMKLTLKPMNLLFTSKGLCLAGLLGAAMAAQAQTFSYNHGDVLIGIRNTAGGANDLVINAGPVAAFTNLAIGGKITITSLTGTLLNSAFADTNNLSWSAFAALDAAGSAEENTLFMTRARADLNTQSTPWRRYTFDSQGNVVGKINGVGTGAYSLGLAQAAGPNNTPTALVEPEAASVAPTYSYRSMLGSAQATFLNWDGTFQGTPEQSTAADFTTAGQPVRADFYLLPPGGTPSSHPAGTYLGYFEFSTNGVLTYTAGPSASVVVAPQITGIVRNGNTAMVTFTTGSGGTYTLRATSDLTTVRANWTALGTVSGNGQTNSLSDTTTATSRFYFISAQ